MNNVCFVLDTLVQLHLPIYKNTVLFQSFYGQYNDNPKYISEELHRRFPDVKIVWVCGDSGADSFPPYAKLVRLGSREYARYIARACAVVDNYSGLRTNFVTSRYSIRRLLFRWMSVHRKGQFCLSTGHGTPLKRISLDEPQYQKFPFVQAYINTDVMIAGDRISVSGWRSGLRWNGEIAEYGTPRNDLLLHGDRQTVRRRLGLPADRKIVLYAPTFRESADMSGLFQLEQLDIQALLETLGERFGGQWSFVFRAHNEVMKAVRGRIPAEKRACILDGNEHEDMAEYLLCCDALITDYSSCMIDYALTGRPCFLYAPDVEEYGTVERGFFYDIRRLPFPLSTAPEGLLAGIRAFEPESYQKGLSAMQEEMGSFERGNAAERVVDRLAEHLTQED